MQPYKLSQSFPPPGAAAPADAILRIAVTFKGRTRTGPTKFPARLSSSSIVSFEPEPGEMETAIEALRRHGFVVSGKGRMTVSIRGTVAQFERVFGTRLTTIALDKSLCYSSPCVYYPPEGADWNPDPVLFQLIDDAYIQWPHIYLSDPLISARPPEVDYFHLDVLNDVPAKLNVPPIHRERHNGEGIRIAMIDTGFDHAHPFFVRNGFTSSVVLAPSASNRATDPGSHGTGESANVFAVAPKVTFIGVKLGDDADPHGGASILEGFQEALKHKPHVITVSMCYDLRELDGGGELRELPNGLKPLEAEIQAAIAAGIVVVFAAGNGHYAFPASMPEVISVGGAFVGEDGAMRASDYASAFTSTIYSGRHVPDVCGLVGLLPFGDYIMLPVPAGGDIDISNAAHDGTTAGDGWAVFSGTSASAPQIAAVCALLLQKNPKLTPAEVKALLTRTAVDVREGAANPASDPEGVGLKAGPGVDGATGAGLVDAHAAWMQA
ncbi:S8 family serine peptidase [Massilia sp. CF038]|uniref:S8 family serine peptidase n=1 Tax=Massilia sp. CF038 TaxID=1881045 RepID=UPI000922B65C|nr:S8 family serine peptidase [Massilia sp. CF038]SHH26638.1 Serine protease, subtilisin family [Massilia sp. CF038]